MKITRRQLRQIINEAILDEAKTKSSGGQFMTKLATGTGALAPGLAYGVATGVALVTLPPVGGVMMGLGAYAGIGALFAGIFTGVASNRFAKSVLRKLGYEMYDEGQIPDDHPLNSTNIINAYAQGAFSTPEELKAHINSITAEKYVPIYNENDIDQNVPEQVEFLRLAKEAGYTQSKVAATIDAITGATGKAKEAFVDQSVEAAKDPQGFFGRAKDSLASLFGGDDEEEETALASLEDPLADDLQKKT